VPADLAGSAESAAAVDVIRGALAAAGDDVEWEEPEAGRFVVTLPGEHKQRTTCALAVGSHALTVNAFVCRRPDENLDEVHRWLLERNVRTYGVSFAVDKLGDIYLVGRVPLHAVTAEEVDRLLGAVLEYADGSFDTILATGFPTAIRREHAWRVKNGEPTASLAAFTHLLDD
jgi:hypothetical protein